MPEPFSPIATARRVLREAATGALATAAADGHPFASYVTVAATAAGEPLMLLSELALHTKNLKRDCRASLLVVGRAEDGPDPLAGPRLTITGHVTAPEPNPAHRGRFLAAHPEAEGYADFRDFAFYRVEVAQAHLVAGFGRIVALAPADLLVDLTGAEPLVEAEPEIVGHMNADHADTTALYATALLGGAPGAWRVTGCDPEGLDLSGPDGRRRLVFPQPVRGPGPLRQVLHTLADQARARRPSSA